MYGCSEPTCPGTHKYLIEECEPSELWVVTTCDRTPVSNPASKRTTTSTLWFMILEIRTAHWHLERYTGDES